MSNEQIDNVIDIFNNMSNEELALFMEMASARTNIYVGKIGKHCISSKIESAHTNGIEVQVNLELTDLDCMTEDDFFMEGLKKAMTSE